MGTLLVAAGACSAFTGLLRERTMVCAPLGIRLSATRACRVCVAGARREISDARLARPAAVARVGRALLFVAAMAAVSVGGGVRRVAIRYALGDGRRYYPV